MKRGRPPGSKNKRSKQKGLVMHAFLRELTKDNQEWVKRLSLESGIGVKDICNDAMAEGLSCCESDGYAELIRFRKNAGKLRRENEEVLPEKGAVLDLREAKLTISDGNKNQRSAGQDTESPIPGPVIGSSEGNDHVGTDRGGGETTTDHGPGDAGIERRHTNEAEQASRSDPAL